MPLDRSVVRSAILRDVARYFGSDVQVDDRLIRALELTDDEERIYAPSSSRVLSHSLRVQASLGYGFQRIGVDFDKLQDRPGFEYDCHPGDLMFDDQFETWFTHPMDRSSSDEFHRVQREQRVSCASIIRACLETIYLDDHYIRVGETFEDVNDAFGDLARAAGASSGIAAARSELPETLRMVVEQADLVDPSAGAQQLALVWEGTRIRVLPMAAFGAHQIGEAPLKDGQLWVARSNVLEPISPFADEALSTLEELINSDAKEIEFQRFFEQHPEFLTVLGNYGKAHSQLILTPDSGDVLVPDFFLEKLDSKLADICDLKRANVELVRAQKNRHRFRSVVMEAVAQLRHYRDFFEDQHNRHTFADRYGLTAYRPRVIVIIGRRQSFEDDIARVRLESDLPSWVDLVTFDDIVSRAESWRSLAHRGSL